MDWMLTVMVAVGECQHVSQDWWFRRAYPMVPAQGMVGSLLKSFAAYPPRGKPAIFSVGDGLKSLEVTGIGHWKFGAACNEAPVVKNNSS